MLPAMSIRESGLGPVKPWSGLEGASVAREERCSKASATSLCYTSRDSNTSLIHVLAAFDPCFVNAIVVL
jgi:hypothetical protein